MKFYAFLFPTKPNVPPNLSGLTEEQTIAAMLVATQAQIHDSTILSEANDFNNRTGEAIDGASIVLYRQLIVAIAKSKLPCKEAVSYFLATEGIEILYTTVQVPDTSAFAIKHRKEYDLNFLETLLSQLVKRGGNIFTMLRAIKMEFEVTELRAALTMLNDEAKQAYVNSIYQHVKYDPKAKVDEQAILDTLGWDAGAFKIIKYSMWGTKRRMSTGQYSRRICPYFFSNGQMLGKTEIAEDILKPLGELVAVMTGPEYLDQSNHTTRELYAVIVDDVDKCDRNEIGSIKSTLTAKTQTARVMYSNTSKRLTVNCWPWFTANKRVAQVMLDTSGNTRYREITINRKVFPFIGKIDWLSLWRSIDESDENMFTSADWEEHAEVAEGQRTQTYLDDFLNAMLYSREGSADQEIVFDTPYSPGTLYRKFEGFNHSLTSTYKLSASKLAREISLAQFAGFYVEVEYAPSNKYVVKSLTFKSNAPAGAELFEQTELGAKLAKLKRSNRHDAL